MSNTTLIIIVLLLAALALIILLKRRPAESLETTETPEPDRREGATAGAEDEDQQVLDQLRAAGSDLSKPHLMEFYLYFPTEELASKVADEIEADGYKVEVKRAPRGSSWMCYVTRRMVPKRAEIAAMGKRFRDLAERYGGEYDGWETEVVQ
jgi:hypothetical protein